MDLRWNLILSVNILERLLTGLLAEMVWKYDGMWFVRVCRLMAAFLTTKKWAIMSWLVLTSLDRYTMALPRWFEMLLLEVIVPKVCTPQPGGGV